MAKHAAASSGLRVFSSSLSTSLGSQDRRVLLPATASPSHSAHTFGLVTSLVLQSSPRGWFLQQSKSGRSPLQNSKGLRVDATLSATEEAPKVRTKPWSWSHDGSLIKINAVEFLPSGSSPTKTILMLPTVSDVSTTEEWHAVAQSLLSKSSSPYRIVCVDWPGLGLSDRPALDYTADLYEKFLTDFVSAEDGPISPLSGESLVVIGGGHAASIAARAVSKGLISLRAMVLVAPTWAGPLPIVFGRDSTMESRYGLLRSTLRSPAVGWAMYKYVVSSEKNIKVQYLTHVYADPDNVTEDVVKSRTALTQREGARFAPTAFLTGLLDPVRSRDEFLSMITTLEEKVPTLVIATEKSPKRSKAEMEALDGAKGVTKFVRVPGALLPQEEYPEVVSTEIASFLTSIN